MKWAKRTQIHAAIRCQLRSAFPRTRSCGRAHRGSCEAQPAASAEESPAAAHPESVEVMMDRAVEAVERADKAVERAVEAAAVPAPDDGAGVKLSIGRRNSKEI